MAPPVLLLASKKLFLEVFRVRNTGKLVWSLAVPHF